MDLETENRIAAILMKEAADLRRQAEKEGVHVYLQQPKPRVRPNPRFLTATVLGVQQANRAVEVNEMWRVRQKETELYDRLKRKSNDQRYNCESTECHNSRESTNKRLDVAGDSAKASSSSTKGGGLKDEELEEFLHSRVKRGRGAVGSRMDETGPYLPRASDSNEDIRSSDIIESRSVYGPEKPKSLKYYESSEQETDDDDGDDDDDRREKKRKRAHSRSSKKRHSEKHRSKSRSKDKEKKRKDEKRSKRKK